MENFISSLKVTLFINRIQFAYCRTCIIFDESEYIFFVFNFYNKLCISNLDHNILTLNLDTSNLSHSSCNEMVVQFISTDLETKQAHMLPCSQIRISTNK